MWLKLFFFLKTFLNNPPKSNVQHSVAALVYVYERIILQNQINDQQTKLYIRTTHPYMYVYIRNVPTPDTVDHVNGQKAIEINMSFLRYCWQRHVLFCLCRQGKYIMVLARLAVRQWLMHPQRKMLFQKMREVCKLVHPLNYIMICESAPLRFSGNKPGYAKNYVCTVAEF